MRWRLKLRVEPEEIDPNPGPEWEPTVYDGSYPQLAEPGDIYINRYRDPPLFYLFNRRGNCELISREELNEWVRNGKMKRPTQDQIPTLPSKRSTKPIWNLPVE